jgi:uncharacterized protein YbbC (DUF1343 family)
MTDFGIDIVQDDERALKQLKSKKVSLVAHPASVDKNLNHVLDVFISLSRSYDFQIVSAFGPQHGVLGEKQDNMIESDDFFDPVYKIPIYSLYGKFRRPLAKQIAEFDVLIFDLQDLGTRIYTFVTTLLYCMEECAKQKKEIWILDRLNPIGRKIEGNILTAGYESFVGAGPMPMRHGLTIGELANWFKKQFRLDLDLKIIKLNNTSQGLIWDSSRTWVNPSPNAANLNMALCYPGSVMLEGTNLSEARGTTRPLEMVGAESFSFKLVINEMLRIHPEVFSGVKIRKTYFQPTFHKFSGLLCEGFQIHTDHNSFSNAFFQPFRLFCVLFKAYQNIYPDFELWRDFSYEYTTGRLPIDIIFGSDFLRRWVSDKLATYQDLNLFLSQDEKLWGDIAKDFYLY